MYKLYKVEKKINAKCSIHLRNNLAYKEKGGVGGYIKRLQEDLSLHGKH